MTGHYAPILVALICALASGTAACDEAIPPVSPLPSSVSGSKQKVLSAAKRFAHVGTQAYLDAVAAGYNHLEQDKPLSTLTAAEVHQMHFAASITNPKILQYLIDKPQSIYPDRAITDNQEYSAVVKVVGPSGACTGTLIGHHSVLTADHCSCLGLPAQIEAGAFPKVIGRVDTLHQFKALDCKTFMSMNGPEQVATLGKLGGDIAVLTGSDNLNPQNRPLYQLGWDASDGPQFTLVSYGNVYPNSPLPKWEGTVIAMPCHTQADAQKSCGQGELLGNAARAPSANVTAIADICSGDSGAGLLAGPSGKSNRISAIVSHSALNVPVLNDVCGGGGVYEEITPAAANWIKQFSD